jgi:hypothetical protein
MLGWPVAAWPGSRPRHYRDSLAGSKRTCTAA